MSGWVGKRVDVWVGWSVGRNKINYQSLTIV